MSFEINIIAVNQKKPVSVDFTSKIIVKNEKEKFGSRRYAEIWPFFSNTKGILYTLNTKKGCPYAAFEICDSDFEVEAEKNLVPEYFLKECQEDLTPLIIKEGFYEEFIMVLRYLLENSPQNRLLFQTSYQCKDREIILGVLKISDFITLLNNRQIFFNVCYIVESD